MVVFEVCLDKIMASVMRYRVKGQERDSHAVLTVGELGILQLMAPSAKKQAPSHCLRNHIPLADLIISHISVIINHETVIKIRHSSTDVI